MQAPEVTAFIEKVMAEPLSSIDKALEGFEWEFEKVRTRVIRLVLRMHLVPVVDTD